MTRVFLAQSFPSRCERVQRTRSAPAQGSEVGGEASLHGQHSKREVVSSDLCVRTVPFRSNHEGVDVFPFPLLSVRVSLFPSGRINLLVKVNVSESAWI